MSWTDIFPVCTDEQVTEYQQNATEDERVLLAEWLGVKRVINPRSGRHLVAASLFWKNNRQEERELPEITRELLMNAGKLGLVSRHSPWKHYVLPLLRGAEELRESRPDVVFRIYLAADLEFLVEDFLKHDCEIYLMKSSSIRHNPGAMWRFLAMEEAGRWVTITDADRAPLLIHDVARTEETLGGGFGLWRMPYMFDGEKHNDHPGYYRTMIACHFGAKGGLPVELLMKAFLWHTQRETMPNECVVRVGERTVRLPIFGTKWPDYGFDEWFLNAVMYPRLAFDGVATFFPTNGNGPAASHWFALDIEYVTWANPKSEVIYFGETKVFDRLKEAKPKGHAESPILHRLIAERRGKRHGVRNLEIAGDPGRLTLAVARYREDLGWLAGLPEDVTVVVYNKGEKITDEKVLGRIDHLEALPNEGREADTYLHHLENYGHDAGENWTAFSQGDPFSHNPAFLQLLRHRDAWADVQSLTSYYLNHGHTPPQVLREVQDSEWIRGIPVRTELSSARSLGNLNWQDSESAYRVFRDYSEFHHLPPGWSLTGHFIESCGLADLAEDAWRAVVVRYAYAAVFAVRNERLSRIPKDCIPKMRELACGHYSGPWMYERLWLHLFGHPFVTEEAFGRAENTVKSTAPMLA